jgi:tartrate-resistant acid phosphatase type 5
MLTRRNLLILSGALAGSTLLDTRRLTAAASPAPVTFLAIGDWGRKGSAEQRRVAVQLAQAAREANCRFVITTGDNFYPRGIRKGDRHWRQSFEEVYTASELACPWFPVLGNHDHLGDVKAQIAYSAKSSRWSMPARYYHRTEVLNDGGTAGFFFIDTTPLQGRPWWQLRGRTAAKRQLKWLRGALAGSRSDWKIVVGHHPVMSGGPNVAHPAFAKELRGLFKRHGVQVYLSGHNHNLQHHDVDGTHYLTSGGGSKSSPARPISGTRFAAKATGFLTAGLSSGAMAIAFIDSDGHRLYAAEISRSTALEPARAKSHG